MTANERREEIIRNLVKEKKAIKGSELAIYFNVTRQVIVKDIAILRAAGKNIIATPDGYMINDNLDNRLASYPCWIAHYGVSSPMATNIWSTNYVGHQYTEKGKVSGINGNVDLNNFTEGILIKGDIIENSVVNNNVNDVEDLGGKDIYSILQRELNKQGFRDKNGNKLKVDGRPGELTLSACPLVRKGAKGEITRWIQLRVGANPDTYFGQETENCVIWMQNKWGITPDGIVGKNTWKKFLGL